jgi:hypothetical protein
MVKTISSPIGSLQAHCDSSKTLLARRLAALRSGASLNQDSEE